MVSSSNSADLARRLPDAVLKLYPDSGHGGVFQHARTGRRGGLDGAQKACSRRPDLG